MITASEVRVRYAETDQMGVAYHAEYLVWCEVGRTDFIRRRLSTFDNMRVALRAQSQCRATFKTLSDLKHPRPRAAPTKKFDDQSVETAKTLG